MPYTKVRLHLSERKLLGVLALAVILASMVFYAAFQLWYAPVLMIFSASIVYIFIRLHYRKVLDGLISELRSVLKV